jgi:hypothetical protein
MGVAAGPNQFWQLFLLAGDATWTLRTPPDIATNGAIAIGGLFGTALVAGVRPSLFLHFSPVTATSDGGQQWSAVPPVDGLAIVPDALAARPGDAQLLAVSASGQVSTAAADATTWTRLVSSASLAATAAGRACGLRQLTGVGYSPAGAVLIAGSCTRPGVAGIFARAGGSWRAVGPVLPAALDGYQLDALRMVGAAAGGQQRPPLPHHRGLAGPPRPLAAVSTAASGRRRSSHDRVRSGRRGSGHAGRRPR